MSKRTGRCRMTFDCSANSWAIPFASRTERRPSRSSRRSGGFRVAFQRKADAAAGRDLDALLKRLSPGETVSVIRAFSYFSHLANLAEDRHHVRRRLVHEIRQEPQDGSLAQKLRQAAAGRRQAPSRSSAPCNAASCRPVLTAHPTEVQRKSTLDAERAICRSADGAGASAELRASSPTTRRGCGPALPSSGRRGSCAPRS